MHTSSWAPWVTGDHWHLQIPADPDALLAGGADFLTRALRLGGAVSADNQVIQIVEAAPFPGGSTGRKMMLDVAYRKPGPPTRLFAKFSRDRTDPVRDRGRFQMDSEVRFALLSRDSGFPITVPHCMFADYHQETGTGILLTERVQFGQAGIEPQYHKCLDYEMPDQLGHYQAIIRALGRLAGTAKAGALPSRLTGGFTTDMRELSVGRRPTLTRDRLCRNVAAYQSFAESNPQLLPATIRTPRFMATLAGTAVAFAEHEALIWNRLEQDTDFVALCHWNANVDNAWFWTDESGVIDCGLLDWGCVGTMNVAMAIWGALCSAETSLWDNHLGALLDLFATEYHGCGGPALDSAAFRRHVILYAVVMGVTWLLDVPRYLTSRLPTHGADRGDPEIRDDEAVRSRLQMMTNFLNLCQTQDLAPLVDEVGS
ncbi:hypothetical protein ACXDF8_19160 [Mycolicibacterium sp. CBM1]